MVNLFLPNQSGQPFFFFFSFAVRSLWTGLFVISEQRQRSTFSPWYILLLPRSCQRAFLSGKKILCKEQAGYFFPDPGHFAKSKDSNVSASNLVTFWGIAKCYRVYSVSVHRAYLSKIYFFKRSCWNCVNKRRYSGKTPFTKPPAITNKPGLIPPGNGICSGSFRSLGRISPAFKLGIIVVRA